MQTINTSVGDVRPAQTRRVSYRDGPPAWAGSHNVMFSSMRVAQAGFWSIRLNNRAVDASAKIESIRNASQRLWLADSKQNKTYTFRIGSSAANQFNLIHGSSSANFLMFDFHVERLKHEDVVAKWTTLTNTFR